MESIILAISKREGVVNVETLAKKTGFETDDIRRVLHILALKGKLTFLSYTIKKTHNSLCSGCHLNKVCRS